MPKVSVIIPLYNSEKYIDKCLLSLNNQTYKDFDVILVDDCSPDNSVSDYKWSMPDYSYMLDCNP